MMNNWQIWLLVFGAGFIGFIVGSIWGSRPDPYDQGSPDEQAWRAAKRGEQNEYF